MDSSGSASVGSLEFGAEKLRTHGLLVSSLDLGWAGLAAELRTHDRVVVEWKSILPEAV